MTDAMVKEALAKRIEETPVGQFAILLGLNDGTHFNEIIEARATIAAALRSPSPAVLDPVTVEAIHALLERHAFGLGSDNWTTAKAIRALIGQPRSPEKHAVADQIIGQIEKRFPNWRSYRDLIDCIDVTLHHLREPRCPVTIEACAKELVDFVATLVEPWMEFRGHKENFAKIIARHLDPAFIGQPRNDLLKAAIRMRNMLTCDGDPPSVLIPPDVDANDFAQAFSDLAAAIGQPRNAEAAA